MAAVHLLRNMMPRGDAYCNAQVADDVADAAYNAALPAVLLYGAELSLQQHQAYDDQEYKTEAQDFF